MSVVPTRVAHREVAERRPFRTNGSLTGRPGHDVDTIGRLDPADPVAVAILERRAAYVVLSYSTPIAALTTDGRWLFTSRWFSATTSRHQGVVRYGASLSGLPVADTSSSASRQHYIDTGEYLSRNEEASA
jgi:hypothetical protein